MNTSTRSGHDPDLGVTCMWNRELVLSRALRLEWLCVCGVVFGDDLEPATGLGLGEGLDETRELVGQRPARAIE